MLRKKLIRDIIKNKVQFISIFLMAALSTYIFVGMASVWYGLECARDGYYEQSNYADYILTSVDGFSKKQIDNLYNCNDVENIQSRHTIYNCIDTDVNADITLHVLKEGKISKCVTVKGDSFGLQEDGIWLDYRYALDNKLKVGDNISLKIGTTQIDKVIKGLVINPEYIYQVNKDSIIPNHKKMGFAFVPYKAVSELVYEEPNELLIKVKEGATLTDKKIEKYIHNYGVMRSKEDILSHVMFSDAINQYKAIGIIFPLAFLAVTVLAMLTTMTRLVDKQRVQIGTLGTLGIKKKKIYIHYLSFGAIPSFFGCLIGFIVAPLSLPYVYYPALKNLYTMEYWKPRVPLVSIIIVVLCVSLCVGVTYIAVRKILKEKPAQAIKPKVSKELEQVDIFKVKLISRLGFCIKWNIVDIIKQKGRVCMTLVGIIGCSGLLVAGFGNRDSLDKVIELQYERLCKYETKLRIDTTNSSNVEKYVANIEDKYYDVDFIYEDQIEIRSNTKRKISNLTVEDGIVNIKYVSKKLEDVELSRSKVNISRKLADALGVKTKDTIEIRLLGTDEYHKVEIKNIYIPSSTRNNYK